MKRFVFIVLISLYACCAGLAQTISDCETLLKVTIDKSKADRNQADQHGFDFAAQISVTGQDGNRSTSRIEMKSYQDKYAFSDGSSFMVQDRATMVVIDPDGKSIFLTRPLPDSFRQGKFNETLTMQDTLMRLLRVTGCSKEWGTVEPNLGLQKIVMVPRPGGIDLGIQTLSFWVDPAGYQVRKIFVEYKPGHEGGLKNYQMVVNRMLIGKNTPFEGSALARVLVGTNLRSEFSGYTLTDNR